MKVLHIITGLASGGAESQLELVLRHTRHDSEVVSLYNCGYVGRQMAARGVRVRDLGMQTNRQLLSGLRLASLVREGGYDVVHVHLYRACVYGRIAAKLAGVPVIVTTEHSLGEEQIEGRPKTRAVRLLYLATDLLSDATVAVSPRVEKRLVEWGVSRKKIRVVPNGVDFERFGFDPSARKIVREEFGIPPEDYVVGAVGRLHPFKRFDVLIKAAGPVLERGGWLLLVGEGQEKDRLQEVARETGLSRRVIFAGERSDVAGLLSALDVFVSPSTEETFGIAILEATAVGVKSIVAACPALDGFQLDGVRRVSGNVNEVRRALLREYERGARLGAPDETIRGIYDIRSVVARLDNLYEALSEGSRL